MCLGLRDQLSLGNFPHQPTQWAMLTFCPVFTSFTREGKRGWGKKSCPTGLLLNPNGELACSLFPSPMEQNGSLDGACKRSLTDGPTAEDDWFVSASKNILRVIHIWSFLASDHQKFISHRSLAQRAYNASGFFGRLPFAKFC